MAIPKKDLYSNRFGVPGEIYEHNPITMIRSMAAEDDAIKFGRAVMLGSTSDQAKIYASATGVFKGVAGFSTQAGNYDSSEYDTNDPVAVVDQGVVLVFVEEAVQVGDTVRIRHTADGTLVAGSFATTADSGKTVVLTGAEFREDSASGVVPLFLNPPFSISADA